MTNVPHNERTYDVVIFGATSFVGQILCRYLLDRVGNDGAVRWAIAGRNAAKLSSVANEIGLTVDHIVADAADAEALTDLVRSTRVVVSTVGPYALYGSDLVAAAVAAGTDYCDLTGEAQWIQQMLDDHESSAIESGARIVHSCGFDSIPSDLGVFFTQKSAEERFGEPCTRVAMRVRAMSGGASGGTIASMMNILEDVAGNSDLRKILTNPYSLAPDGMRSGVRQPNVKKPQRDEASNSWVAPFVMASINTKIVHRSHALLGRPWGDDFLYDEAMMMGEGLSGAAKASATTGALGVFAGLSSLAPTRSLLTRYVLPKPGEGPSTEKKENGFFSLRFFGETATGDKVVTSVTGDRDPGYGSTAKMLGEATLALVDLPHADRAGGFWTPATAFGNDLIERLERHAGLQFSII
jgi:short subunit dehydrogenase-like uncharacterized protein